MSLQTKPLKNGWNQLIILTSSDLIWLDNQTKRLAIRIIYRKREKIEFAYIPGMINKTGNFYQIASIYDRYIELFQELLSFSILFIRTTQKLDFEKVLHDPIGLKIMLSNEFASILSQKDSKILTASIGEMVRSKI